MAYEHACSSSALHLTAREANTARPDRGVQSVRHLLDVLFQHGGMNSSRQIGCVFRDTQQDIVAHRGAEQARDLRSIGCVRRFEEISGIGDALTVPVDFSTLLPKQAEQPAKQPCFTGTNAT